MRIIDVPADIEIKGVTDERGNPLSHKVDFKGWLQTCLDFPKGPFAEAGPAIGRLAEKLAKRIEEANGSIAFEEAEFEKVRAAVGVAWFMPIIKRQIIAFYDAIEKAQETPPTLTEKATK